jgi:hypothetical protein
MKAYSATGWARIQPHDGSAVRATHRVMGGGSFAGPEWQRECRAEAEVDRLLKQNGVTPQASVSRLVLLRQTIGAALVHAGARLAGGPQRGVSLETVPLPATPGIAG